MKFESVDRKEIPGARIEVVSYGPLAGSSDARTAEQLFFLREAGMRLKAVRLALDGAAVRVEPGALHWMRGALEMRTSTGGGLLRAAARRLTTGESFFVNEIRGKGDVMLEPTYGHFILAEIEDETLIVDKGMFYAGAGEIDVGASMQRTLGAGVFGGEGWFQTSISGRGVAALFSPVPMEELVEIDLREDRLAVDGNFALMRTGGVRFKVEKSSKSWAATSVSGEGLLQVFEGTGKVWLAPTQAVYQRLVTPEGLAMLAQATGARSNDVRT